MAKPLSDLNIRLMDEICFQRGLLEKCREFIGFVYTYYEFNDDLQPDVHMGELLDEIDAAIKGKACVNYKKLLKEEGRKLELYQRAVDKIDNYLKYPRSSEQIREKIFGIIDKLTERLTKHGNESNKKAI